MLLPVQKCSMSPPPTTHLPHPQDTFQISYSDSRSCYGLASAYCPRLSSHHSSFILCAYHCLLAACLLPQGLCTSGFLCLTCQWQSHLLRNSFLTDSYSCRCLREMASIYQFLLFPQNLFMILSMDSDISRSFCVSEPPTELSRPMEGLSWPRLQIGRGVRGGRLG